MRFLSRAGSSQAGMLAIDTSTEQAGIALSTADGVFVHSWPASRAQTTTVLPEIDLMVQQAGMAPSDISGLVVATGPGTFTGLRVGLAIAKGIVAARQVPIVGIPTLDIVFASYPDRAISAVLPAGRGRVVWQQRNEKPINMSIDELVAALHARETTRLVGELTAEQELALRNAGVRVQNEHRDPLILLKLGATRFAAADLDDPVTLEPTYLHGVTVNAGPIQDRLRRKP